jgi:hypothetical protein
LPPAGTFGRTTAGQCHISSAAHQPTGRPAAFVANLASYLRGPGALRSEHSLHSGDSAAHRARGTPMTAIADHRPLTRSRSALNLRHGLSTGASDSSPGVDLEHNLSAATELNRSRSPSNKQIGATNRPDRVLHTRNAATLFDYACMRARCNGNLAWYLKSETSSARQKTHTYYLPSM